MPLYDIRGKLYEYKMYETLDYTITRYKRNSVYDSTLVPTQDKSVTGHFLLYKTNTSQVNGPLDQSRMCGEGVGLCLFLPDSLESQSYDFDENANTRP